MTDLGTYGRSDVDPEFDKWYAEHSSKYGLDPNPDDVRHDYDYRSAFKAGARADEEGHLPSKFKHPEHPNRYVEGVDTITGEPEGGSFYQEGEEGLLTEPLAPGQMPFGDAGPMQEGNLRPQDELFYLDADPLESLPSYRPVDVEFPTDLFDAKSSKELYDLTLKAFQDEDYALYRQYQQLQREQAFISEQRIMTAGGDPSKQVAANAAWTDLDIEVERQVVQRMQRNMRENRLFKEHGWEEFEDYVYNSVFPRYKAQNEAAFKMKHAGMSDEELVAYHQQLEPLVEPHAVLEQWQQRLDKLNAALKESYADDPLASRKISVYNHPKTRKIANWIGREVNSQQLGYVVSDKPEVDITALQRGAKYAFSVAKPAIDFAGMLAFGLGPAIDSLTNGTIGWGAPTNYIEGPDGKIYDNSGKVPGGVEFGATVWALMTGENVKEMIARANAADAWEKQTQNGFDSVVTGVGMGIGMIASGGGIYGAAMKVGFTTGAKLGAAQVITKGLAKLGASQSPRALALTRNIAGTLGAVSASAGVEAVMFGRPGDYWKSLWHGALMAPIMVGVIKAGGRIEGAIRQQIPRMPMWFHRGVAGTLEGGMFTGFSEAASLSIWGMIHDPNKSRMETYLETMAAFGIFKAAFGSSMRRYEGQRRQQTRDFQTKRLGEDFARGEAEMARGREIEVIDVDAAERTRRAQERGLSEEALTDLGEAESARKAAKTPAQEKAAQKLLGEAQDQINREDQGAGRQAREIEVEFEQEIEGVQPSAEKQMEQAARGELPEPPMISKKERQARRAGKEEAQGRDPLEDPDFQSRPEGERRAIMEGGTAKERRQIAESYEGPERREGTRRMMDAIPEGVGPDAREMANEPSTEGVMHSEGYYKKLEEEDGPRAVQAVRYLNEAGIPTMDHYVDQTEGTISIEILNFDSMDPRVKARILEEGRIDEDGFFEIYLADVPLLTGALPPKKGKAKKPGLEGAIDTIKDAMEGKGLEPGPALKPGPPVKVVPGAMYEVGYSGVSVDALEAMAEALRGDTDLRISGHAIMTWDAGVAQTYRDALRALGAEARVFTTFPEGGETIDPREPPTTLGASTGGGAPPPPGGPPPSGPSPGAPRPRRTVPGTGSMQPAASPYRQKVGTPGAPKRRRSDVVRVMQGRPGHPGVRIPYTTKRIGGTKGTAVVVAVRSGFLRARNVGGIYDIFRNMIRTRDDLAVVTDAHEWSHAAQRQVHLPAFQATDVVKAAEAWVNSLPVDAQMEIPAILEGYHNWEKLERGVQGMEAWAEWMARDLLGDETLDLEAPAFSRWMRKWIAAPQQAHFRESSYDPVKKVLQEYMEQGFESQADEDFLMRGDPKFRVDLRGAMERISDAAVKGYDRMVNAWTDDIQHLKSVQTRALRQAGIEPGSLSIFEDPSRVLDITRNMGYAQAENFFLRGVYDFEFRHQPGTKGMLEIGRMVAPNVKEWGLYLAHHRAYNQVKRGKKMGLPAKVFAKSVLEKSRRHPEFKQAARAYKVLTDGLLDLCVECGSLSPTDAKQMKAAGILYIPLQAAIEGPPPHGVARGVAERGKGTKALRGHTSLTRDPLQAFTEVVQEMLAKAYHNVTMKAIYRLGLKEGMGNLVTIVDRSAVPHEYNLRDVFNNLRKTVRKELAKRDRREPTDTMLERELGIVGALMTEAEVSEAVLTLFTQVGIPFGESRPIAAFTPLFTKGELDEFSDFERKQAEPQLGHMLHLEFDIDVYNTLMGVNKTLGIHNFPAKLQQALTLPKEAERKMAVTLNPFFALDNLLRDVPSRIIYTAGEVSTLKEAAEQPWKAVSRIFEAFPRVAEMLRKGDHDRVFEIFEGAGVGMSSIFSEGKKAEMRGEIDPQTQTDQLRRLWRWANDKAKWLEHKISVGESGLRLRSVSDAYIKAIAEGKSEREATFIGVEAGQEDMINFARGGHYARIMNQMANFITANFAGVRKTMRALSGSDGKTDRERAARQRAASISGFTLLTIPAIIAWAINEGEDWYDDVEEWEKLRYLHVGPNVKVTVPFELGTIFMGTPQAFLDWLGDDNPVRFASWMQSAVMPYLRGIADIYEEGMAGMAESFAPVAPKGILEVQTGWNFFFSSRIGKVPKTESAKWIFRHFRKLAQLAGADSPKEIEHLLEAYSAGKSTVALQMWDQLFGLKDHGWFNTLTGRWTREPFQRSRALTEIYRVQRDLDRILKEDRSEEDHRRLAIANAVIQQVSQIRTAVDLGHMTQVEGNKRISELSRSEADRIKQKVR